MATAAHRPAGAVIRRAISSDRAAVERIVQAAYEPYIVRIGRKPGPMLEDYASLIRAGHVHVAECEGIVAGLIVLIREGDVMLLDNVAVAPALRGTGLGRHLLTFAEAQARTAGCTTIRLYTHEAMTENLALYARIGYRETHRAEQHGFSRVFLAKPLA